MNWKLLTGIPVVAIIFIMAWFFARLYQFEHRYDHLPKVIALPQNYSTPVSLSAYQGGHPSQLLRPTDIQASLIKLDQVGPSQALFAGPKQYPFLCNTLESGLGQPLVDNQQGFGMPIYKDNNLQADNDAIIGYSQDCNIKTRAWYYYQSSQDNRFYRLENAHNDIAVIELDGRRVPFIVRVEMGTINRFIYTIAVLKGAKGLLDKPDKENWNKKLIYQFRGGVGVGHRQGVNKPTDILKRRAAELKKGYGILYSTANQTANHYNIWLSEDTALRVKQQFNFLYGEEDYLVGIGGSGGAVQQYLIGQNNPGFLDAAIALYSYPDMITQTSYVFDCELFEYYFDVTDNQNRKWRSWENRRLVEGMNASSGITNKFSVFYDFVLKLKGFKPPVPAGMSVCSKSWRGITPLVNNPRSYHHYQRYSDKVFKQTHWTHWQDLKFFYGTDDNGYAQSTFDNVGVQYGLTALLAGNISLDEFLKLNARIGGWKTPSKMLPERFWKLSGEPLLSTFSPWGEHNMTFDGSQRINVAARSEGNISAMKAAYRSGNVFLGKLDIPVIDLRHYLDEELDMHHASASFATRERMLRAQGHFNNQLIWFSKKPHSPLAEALDVVDNWLTRLKKVKAYDIQTALHLSRPENARDRCYSGNGELLAQGNGVWNGAWNNKQDGDCMKRYPIYPVSRTLAGAPIAGDTFKCALQSVDAAYDKGIYQNAVSKQNLPLLKRVFPDGVCDYGLQDLGLPSDSYIAELIEHQKSEIKLDLRTGQ